MKKINGLSLIFVILISLFTILPLALAIDNSAHEAVVILYSKPPEDDSMTNPDYQLSGYHWYSTINYYVNPANKYGFSTTAVVDTITIAADTWDEETSYQVFNYKGTTSKAAGRRDGYSVVAWDKYQSGVIAVTYIWYTGTKIVETDCRMNTHYRWSLNGETAKMDAQNIMTHEFGHWCGLKDLYSDADYWLTMYGYSNYRITYQQTLGQGDINGLHAVYGP